MPAYVTGDERTLRNYVLALTPHVTECRSRQRAPYAPALVGRIDLGVGENHEVGLGSIERGPGQAAVDEHVIPLLARVVPHLDLSVIFASTCDAFNLRKRYAFLGDAAAPAMLTRSRKLDHA